MSAPIFVSAFSAIATVREVSSFSAGEVDKAGEANTVEVAVDKGTGGKTNVEEVTVGDKVSGTCSSIVEVAVDKDTGGETNVEEVTEGDKVSGTCTSIVEVAVGEVSSISVVEVTVDIKATAGEASVGEVRVDSEISGFTVDNESSSTTVVEVTVEEATIGEANVEEITADEIIGSDEVPNTTVGVAGISDIANRIELSSLEMS